METVLAHRGSKSSACSARRRKTQSGSSWVETAIVLLPFLALLYGVFDVAYAVFLKSCLLNAAREGARYALTYHSDAQIKTVVQQYSVGFLAGTNANLIAVNYYPCTPSGGCSTTAAASGGNVPGNIVEIAVVNYPFSWISPLTGKASSPDNLRPRSFTFNVVSTDVLGGAPATGIPAR